MEQRCSDCGETFAGLGQHLAFSDCQYPPVSDEKKEIIDGVLMGDGSLSTQNKNPYFRVVNISKEYLEYLDEKFGVLTTGVKLLRSAEESAKRDRRSGFNSDALAENYSDVYYIQSISHPKYSEYEKWYGDNGKSFSEHARITRTSVTHWYTCDGCIRSDRGNQIKISAVNEMAEIDKLRDRIEGSPCPNFDRVESSDDEHFSIVWDKQSAKELLEFMDGPIPGYEYKYPNI